MAEYTDRDDSARTDDVGTKDFWFGVIGLGVMALLAIVLAVVS